MSLSSSLGSDPILVSYHDSIIRLSNLKTLDDASWLDDNIINFAFEYVQYELNYSNEVKNMLLYVSPPVVQLIKMSDDLLSEQLLQSLDLNDKDFLILPINDNECVTAFGGSHWSLLIFSIQEKILYHFDSATAANDRTAKNIQGKLRVFYHEDIQLLKCRCPQQTNGFDCGLYLISIVEEFSRFTQEYFSSKPNNQLVDSRKDFFDKFTNEINQFITPTLVHQQRQRFRKLIQTMSNEKK